MIASVWHTPSAIGHGYEIFYSEMVEAIAAYLQDRPGVIETRAVAHSRQRASTSEVVAKWKHLHEASF